MMKAIWFEQTGPASDVLIYAEQKKPKPMAGEVLVKLAASAVNPSDVKKRAGAQPAGFVDGLVIPHSDGAGIVEAVGDGVESSRIGERVWIYQAQYQRHLGTAAQYICLPDTLAPKLPDEVCFEIGACIGVPMMTAHRCVFNTSDIKGKRLLVTGASGRVGYYAVQWAKLAGANVIATAGNEARCAVAKQAGADVVINYKEPGLAHKIMHFTQGSGVDHIVDVEFGVNIDLSSEVLKNCGSISTYSSSQNSQPNIPFYPLMFKNITVNMVLVYNMPDAAKQHAIKDIYKVLSNNQFTHKIAEIWPLKDTAKAHEAIEQGGRNGCVILKIP